jgi:hypothetical protein
VSRVRRFANHRSACRPFCVFARKFKRFKASTIKRFGCCWFWMPRFGSLQGQFRGYAAHSPFHPAPRQEGARKRAHHPADRDGGNHQRRSVFDCSSASYVRSLRVAGSRIFAIWNRINGWLRTLDVRFAESAGLEAGAATGGTYLRLLATRSCISSRISSAYLLVSEAGRAVLCEGRSGRSGFLT